MDFADVLLDTGLPPMPDRTLFDDLLAEYLYARHDHNVDTDEELAAIRALAALSQQTEGGIDTLRTALWQCGVESGMDTDGDDAGALIAGMGDAGFASAMVEEVRRLRLAYDECLAEPEAGIDVVKVLAETLHEMQCRRRHPHPWDHSYSMMAGQLARALSAARLTAPGKSA